MLSYYFASTYHLFILYTTSTFTLVYASPASNQKKRSYLSEKRSYFLKKGH